MENVQSLCINNPIYSYFFSTIEYLKVQKDNLSLNESYMNSNNYIRKIPKNKDDAFCLRLNAGNNLEILEPDRNEIEKHYRKNTCIELDSECKLPEYNELDCLQTIYSIHNFSHNSSFYSKNVNNSLNYKLKCKKAFINNYTDEDSNSDEINLNEPSKEGDKELSSSDVDKNIVKENNKKKLGKVGLQKILSNLDTPPFIPSKYSKTIESLDSKEIKDNESSTERTSSTHSSKDKNHVKNHIYESEKSIEENKASEKNGYLVEMFGRRGWICKICNNFNYETRNRCNRCGIPKRPENIVGYKSDKTENTIRDFKEKNRKKNDWFCINCRNLNYAFRKICNRCKTPKLCYILNDVVIPQLYHYNQEEGRYIVNNKDNSFYQLSLSLGKIIPFNYKHEIYNS